MGETTDGVDGGTEKGDEMSEEERKKEEASKEERDEAEAEEALNKMAKKQGLMTDEEFERLLKGVQIVEEDTTRMAEGLDNASTTVEKESPKEQAEDVVNASTKSGAAGEDEESKQQRKREDLPNQ